MNFWDSVHASCSAPEEEDKADEEPAPGAVRADGLHVGKGRSGNKLSYRDILYQPDGKVKPPFSEKNTINSMFSVGKAETSSARAHDVEAYALTKAYVAPGHHPLARIFRRITVRQASSHDALFLRARLALGLCPVSASPPPAPGRHAGDADAGENDGFAGNFQGGAELFPAPTLPIHSVPGFPPAFFEPAGDADSFRERKLSQRDLRRLIFEAVVGHEARSLTAILLKAGNVPADVLQREVDRMVRDQILETVGETEDGLVPLSGT